MGPVLKTYDNWDFLGANLDSETAKKVANCEIDPMTHQPLKLMVEASEERLQLQRTQRVFQRKNPASGKGQQQQMIRGYSGKNLGLKKFFGVQKPS